MFALSLSRSIRLPALTAALVGSCAMIAGAATPKPPATLCIGSNCVTAPGASGAVKWHPGVYIWPSGPGWSTNTASATNAVLAATSKDTSVSGIQIIFKWADLEGATPGDYSAGFAIVDSLLAQLAKQPTPKRLMISVMERAFGTANGNSPTGLLPAYIINMPNGSVVAPKGSGWAGGLVAIAHIDNPAVMDHLIALTQAYGNRYNSNPLLEMWSPMDESSVSVNAGFNTNNFIAQMQRLYTAASAAWPNTLVRWRLNYMPGDDSQMREMLTSAQGMRNSIIGGPDPEVPLPITTSYPSGVRVIQGNMVYRGLQTSSSQLVQAYPDLRGSLPWVGEYQGANRIGAGYVLPDAFGEYEINVMHASHIVYLYNTWSPASTPSSDPHKWAAQLAYIDSIKGQTYAAAPVPK